MLTVLDTLVLGIPVSVLIVEGVQDGRLHQPQLGVTLSLFVAAWLVLLVVWLATGHLNRPRARVAWYCLLASLAAMAFVLRPELQ